MFLTTTAKASPQGCEIAVGEVLVQLYAWIDECC